MFFSCSRNWDSSWYWSLWQFSPCQGTVHALFVPYDLKRLGSWDAMGPFEADLTLRIGKILHFFCYRLIESCASQHPAPPPYLLLSLSSLCAANVKLKYEESAHAVGKRGWPNEKKKKILCSSDNFRIRIDISVKKVQGPKNLVNSLSFLFHICFEILFSVWFTSLRRTQRRNGAS